MTNKQSPAARIKKAKVRLLLDQPFFGTLVTRLPCIEDPTIDTACTDGTAIWWNPKFVDGLTDAELCGVLAHEVLHVSNGHTWRRGGRDPEAWNVAADKAINPIVLNADMQLPADCLMPPQGSENRSAEQHYVAPPKGGGGGQGGNQGGAKGGNPGNGQPGGGKGKQPAPPDKGRCGGVKDAPNGSEGKKKQEAEWKVAVAQAAAVAKAQGKLPADLERLVKELVDPQVPWEVLLRDFVERTARNDYNWAAPNRRYLTRGIVLPSLVSEELPEIVIAVDTSGSIAPKELEQFAAEVSAVLGCYETTIRVVYCDARVAGVETVTRADLPLTLSPKGGGGTAFEPVFKWVEEQGVEPACVIYLTDLYGSFPATEPGYPVLWVSTSDKVAPWGETVKMDGGRA